MSVSPRKGRQNLTKEQIIRTARAMVKEHGLQSVTLRAVAKELGVNPTAITWHIGSKRNLLVEVSGVIFRELRLADDRSMTAYEWLMDSGRRFRKLIMDNPNYAPLIGGQLASKPPSLPFVERVLRVLGDLGLRGDGLIVAFNAYTGVLLGWAALELSEEPAEAAHEVEENYRETLHDAEPALYTALNDHGMEVLNKIFMLRWSNGTTLPLDKSYEFLLEAVVSRICQMAHNKNEVSN